MNESHMIPNTFFSGGPDCQIKIWDAKYGELKQEFEYNKSGIGSLVVFENPLLNNELDNYYVMSFGENKGDVVLVQPKTGKAFEIVCSMETEFHAESTKVPCLQLYKKGGNMNEEGFGLVTFSNTGDKKYLIILNVK